MWWCPTKKESGITCLSLSIKEWSCCGKIWSSICDKSNSAKNTAILIPSLLEVPSYGIMFCAHFTAQQATQEKEFSFPSFTLPYLMLLFDIIPVYTDRVLFSILFLDSFLLSIIHSIKCSIHSLSLSPSTFFFLEKIRACTTTSCFACFSFSYQVGVSEGRRKQKSELGEKFMVGGRIDH